MNGNYKSLTIELTSHEIKAKALKIASLFIDTHLIQVRTTVSGLVERGVR